MKKFLIPGTVVLVVLVLVGGFLLMKPRSSTPTPQESTVPNQEALEKKSLKDLLTQFNNQECTFSDVESGNSGVVYAAGGRARGDFKTDGENAGTSHMIYDGTTVYIWVDGQAQGFKATFADIEKFRSQMGSDTINIDDQVDYDCNGWSADQSKFVVPTEIKFTDFGSMTIPSGVMTNDGKNSSGSSDATKQAQCASCNNLPASAKAQCFATLGC